MSSLLKLYYDRVNKQYVKSPLEDVAYGFDSLYYSDYKNVEIQLLTPNSSSTVSNPFVVDDISGSLLYLNLGTIDATGSITNFTGSLLAPSGSTNIYTGFLNLVGVNLTNVLNSANYVDATWQLKKYTSQSIDTIDSRNISIYKVLDGGQSIGSFPTSIFVTSASYATFSLTSSYVSGNVNSASYALSSSYVSGNVNSSSYALSSSYASSSTLPIVNADPSTKGSATDTVTLTVDAQGRITSWTSQAITLTTGGTYNITSSWSNKSLSASYSPIDTNYSASVSLIKQNTLTNTLYTITSSLSTTASYIPQSFSIGGSLYNASGITTTPTLPIWIANKVGAISNIKTSISGSGNVVLNYRNNGNNILTGSLTVSGNGNISTMTILQNNTASVNDVFDVAISTVNTPVYILNNQLNFTN